jgi:hypothetical protein
MCTNDKFKDAHKKSKPECLIVQGHPGLSMSSYLLQYVGSENRRASDWEKPAFIKAFSISLGAGGFCGDETFRV